MTAPHMMTWPISATRSHARVGADTPPHQPTRWQPDACVPTAVRCFIAQRPWLRPPSGCTVQCGVAAHFAAASLRFRRNVSNAILRWRSYGLTKRVRAHSLRMHARPLYSRKVSLFSPSSRDYPVGKPSPPPSFHQFHHSPIDRCSPIAASQIYTLPLLLRPCADDPPAVVRSARLWRGGLLHLLQQGASRATSWSKPSQLSLSCRQMEARTR